MRPAESLVVTVLKRRGRPSPCRASQGSSRVSRGAEEAREIVGNSLYCGFRGSKGRAGLEPASLSNAHGLWAQGCPGCLALARVRRAGDSGLSVGTCSGGCLECERRAHGQSLHCLQGLARPGGPSLHSQEAQDVRLVATQKMKRPDE